MNEPEKENAKRQAEPGEQKPPRRQARMAGSGSTRDEAIPTDRETLRAEAVQQELRDIVARAFEGAMAAVGRSSKDAGAGGLGLFGGPPSSIERDFSDEVSERAPQSMFRDIDAILARVETSIAAERAAMDALLERLTSSAAVERDQHLEPGEVGANHPSARQPTLIGGVAFVDVDFHYPDRPPLFRGFTLRISPGEHVALVGPSGAGKSTLIKLVQRLIDIEGGQVLIDGQDIHAMTQDSLRAAVAVVPQEISLFHRSVLENIRYARPKATDEEVFAAARAAGCDDFIRALPLNYDTIVGEHGIKLSGAERQRLGIARALLKDAPIIIFDEVTSALDSASDGEIQRALESLMEGRTVLAIAHRLSTVTKFDRVVVMDAGQIVEDGPPAELRRRHGLFDRMCRLQEEEVAAKA